MDLLWYNFDGGPAETGHGGGITQLKFIIEQHDDGFVAYPLGLFGIVVGEGNTSDEALQDARSAAKFHIETFGNQALHKESSLVDAFIVEAGVDA